MNFNMKFFFKYICTVLILSSCVSSKHLAPVVDKSNINYQELETNESSKELIIAEGDSLYIISKREGVSVREIIVINKLEAPFTLYPGDQLIIPTTKQHLVKKGENLWNL